MSILAEIKDDRTRVTLGQLALLIGADPVKRFLGFLRTTDFDLYDLVIRTGINLNGPDVVAKLPLLLAGNIFADPAATPEAKAALRTYIQTRINTFVTEALAVPNDSPGAPATTAPTHLYKIADPQHMSEREAADWASGQFQNGNNWVERLNGWLLVTTTGTLAPDAADWQEVA